MLNGSPFPLGSSEEDREVQFAEPSVLAVGHPGARSEVTWALVMLPTWGLAHRCAQSSQKALSAADVRHCGSI